ncbi:MAG: AAA family ATPase [Candidatus Aenigmarchaeota archaeon]|nr:AAA family ATPase [Candidatus Aenigmarchaeota archaeon]
MDTNGTENLLEIVKSQNPWHNVENKDWFLTDGSLREVMEAERNGLFEPPKVLFYLEKAFFDPLFSDTSKWGAVIMLGPRRIGKTSTLKYIVKRYIDEGMDRTTFIYVTLDQDELLIELDKKRVLREFLSTVIDTYKKPNKPLFIILDEVTFYRGWARAIKNLVDSGKLGPGIGLIATGSYSLDLSSAKRELAGRFGPLGERLKGEVYFYPRRFIEVAESLLGSDFRNFVKNNFGSFGKRAGLIEYLAGHQKEVNANKYGYHNILQSLFSKYYDDLHSLFENIYLKTGGYPRAIYEAVINQRTGQVSVSDARYRDDIFTLFVTDSKKFDLSEETLKNILSKINLPSMRISSDYSTLSSLRKEETQKYIEYLKTSGFTNFLPNITSSNEIDTKSLLVTPRGNILKMVINDPASFLSIYLGSRGVETSVFNQIEKILADKSIKEHLYEAIILSHLQHIPPIQVSAKNIGYILVEEKNNAELADGFCWYINFKSELVLIAVESKHADKQIDIKSIEEKALRLKELFDVNKLIVVTNLKQLEIKENYVIMPIEIFLALM